MKILFIPSTFLPSIGGAEIQTHNLANMLCDKGLKVDVLSFEKKFLDIYKYKKVSINNILINCIYYLQYYFGIDLTFILSIYFKRKKFSYDIWHFHSLNFKTLIILKTAKNINKKICLTLQGADIQIDRKIEYGYRLDEKYNNFFLKNLKNVDYFFSISKNIKEDLLKIGVEEKKIINFPNTVVLKKFI